MAKNPNTWKKFETFVAKRLGGKRRGAYTGDGRKGKSDIVRPQPGVPWFSVEVKYSARPSWGLLVDAVEQARRASETPLDIPIAVVKKKGMASSLALVVMRLDDFAEHFGDG